MRSNVFCAMNFGTILEALAFSVPSAVPAAVRADPQLSFSDDTENIPATARPFLNDVPGILYISFPALSFGIFFVASNIICQRRSFSYVTNND